MGLNYANKSHLGICDEPNVNNTDNLILPRPSTQWARHLAIIAMWRARFMAGRAAAACWLAGVRRSWRYPSRRPQKGLGEHHKKGVLAWAWLINYALKKLKTLTDLLSLWEAESPSVIHYYLCFFENQTCAIQFMTKFKVCWIRWARGNNYDFSIWRNFGLKI